MVKKIIASLIALTLAFSSVNISYVDASKVRLSKTITFVRIGTPLKLKVKNTKKKVKWKSSNKKIATVSKKGVVKGKKDGECYITAKVGKKKLKCHCVVTHPVAKKITKKTMKKISKAIKKKGSYDSSNKCYIYRKRFFNKNNVDMAILKYYPKTNHIVINLNDTYMNSDLIFKVGDKDTCTFDAESYEHGIYAKGTYTKKKASFSSEAINITDSNIADQYVNYAKGYIFDYARYQVGLLESILKELKTNVYSEDLGFKWSLNDYINE